jgi:hypothetical protein
MNALRNAVFATGLLAAPFVFVGQDAQASTVTGSVTYEAMGSVFATRDGSDWTVVGSGSFTASGGLSDYGAVADGWKAEGMVHVPGVGMLSETETFDDPVSAMGLMSAILPYDSERFLFTLFANAMVGLETVAGGTLSDTYTFGGGWGLFPAGDMLEWTVTSISGTALPGEGGVDISGDIEFTLSGSDIDATIASVTEFFFGAPMPTDLVLASLPSGVIDVKTSITVSPMGSTAHPIPVPAALPLLAGGLGVLGMMGWRRRRAA